jgi:DnaJ-class molecular chaperone
MNIIDNYYDIFNISNNATRDDIIIAYKININKFNFNNLSDEDIYKIKLLKTGLYILLNYNLKKNYDKKLEEINNNTSFSIFNYNTPDKNEQNIESQFNVDNSWMENINIENNNQKKKDLNISDRVFDLSFINKQISLEDDIDFKNKKQYQVKKND